MHDGHLHTTQKNEKLFQLEMKKSRELNVWLSFTLFGYSSQIIRANKNEMDQLFLGQRILQTSLLALCLTLSCLLPNTKLTDNLPQAFTAQAKIVAGWHLSKQISMNVSTLYITVTHKRLVLTHTEAIVVLVKQDSLAMVQCVQVCNINLRLVFFIHWKLAHDLRLPVSFLHLRWFLVLSSFLWSCFLAVLL